MSTVDQIARLPKSILKNELTTTQGKLWAIFSAQYDEWKVADDQIRLLNVITVMTGANLDNLGEIIGITRGVLSDVDYRVQLQIGIQRFLSKGDIYSINDILLALGYTNINLRELFEADRWDGTWLLDGSRILDGISEPATFSIQEENNVDDVPSTLEIQEHIDAVRGAGIEARIGFTWISNESQGYEYGNYWSVMDGSGLWDGMYMLDPSIKQFTPDKIAVGDGAEPAGVREPQLGDTGLQNELLRKDVISFTDTDGKRAHLMEISRSELTGDTINEFAIFRGTEMIWADAFVGKLKPADTSFILKLKETD